MSKKYSQNYSTKSSDIIEYIMSDYVSVLENDVPQVDIIQKLPFLISNNRACKIQEVEWFSGASFYCYYYAVASQFMQKYNPKLKKNRRSLKDWEYGGKESKFAKNEQRLIKLAKQTLDYGTYYCQMDDWNYGILVVSHPSERDEDSDYSVKIEFYLIGKHWNKYKNKFFKQVDKYKAIGSKEKTEKIRKGKKIQNAIFKPFSQVIFKDKERILKYIDNWVNNIPLYYEEYKMVSKLSMLIYGIPGTGKSTFAKAVANYLGIDTVVEINADYFDNDDNKGSGYGNYYAMRYGYDAVYTIDDIDCICNSRQIDNSKENNEMIQNLLSFLDNPPTFFYKAKNGVRYPVSIVIATTNYIDKLDEAIKRYGRFDLQFEMLDFDKTQAQAMCDIYHLKIEDLVPECNEEGWLISPSYLQSLCLENIDKSMKEVSK